MTSAEQGVGRFAADVRAVLTGAGWHPGRDVSGWVDRWLATVYDTDPDARERLPLFPAARAALSEFGGLRLTQLTRIGYAGGGFKVELWPDAGRVVVATYAEFGTPVFPLAWYEDKSSDLVIAADGRVILLHPADEFLVGDSVDEALTEIIRGPELRVLG